MTTPVGCCSFAHLHFQQIVQWPMQFHPTPRCALHPIPSISPRDSSLLMKLILIYADLIKMCCMQSGKTKFLVFMPIVKRCQCKIVSSQGPSFIVLALINVDKAAATRENASCCFCRRLLLAFNALNLINQQREKPVFSPGNNSMTPTATKQANASSSSACCWHFFALAPLKVANPVAEIWRNLRRRDRES